MKTTARFATKKRILSFGWTKFLRRTDTKTKMYYQVLVFLKWRKKKRMPAKDYEEWLNLFLEHTDKDDVLDIEASDIMRFIEEMEHVHNGSLFRMRRIELVLRQFKRYYSARGNMFKDIADYQKILAQGNVNYMVDQKRNRKIYELWISVQGSPRKGRKWTLRSLGEEFGISHIRVSQIIKEEMARQSHLKMSF